MVLRNSRTSRTVTKRSRKHAEGETAAKFAAGDNGTQNLELVHELNQYSRENPTYSKAARKTSPKKIALYVCASIVLVIVCAGAALGLWINSLATQLTGDLTDEELAELADLLATETNFDEPFYVLLIGSDARSDDASMGARSDTNIVVRVDLSTGTITLISIPRDTMIELEGYGTVKFNAAYAYGGAAATIKAANELLGITISHYAEIDFEGLVDLIDAIGGVYLYVDSTIDDSKAGDVVVEEGWQTLDGEAALVYARSRQYTDGDFTRTSHQRTLVTAVIEKILSLSVTELPSVLEAAVACVTTDLDLNDILELVLLFMDVDELTIYSCMVPSTTGTVDGVSYVFTDEITLAEMMEVVEAGGDPSGFTGTYTSSLAASLTSSDTDDDSDDDATDDAGDDAADDSGGGGYDGSGYSGDSNSSGSSGSGSSSEDSSSDTGTDDDVTVDVTVEETTDDDATSDDATTDDATTDGSTVDDTTSDDATSDGSTSTDDTSSSDGDSSGSDSSADSSTDSSSDATDDSSSDADAQTET